MLGVPTRSGALRNFDSPGCQILTRENRRLPNLSGSKHDMLMLSLMHAPIQLHQVC